MSKRVLAISCHPDDIELMMAGTLIRLQAAGYEAHYINVANGSLGTNRHDYQTIVPMRRLEAMESARLIGAVYYDCLCDDLEVYYHRDLLARLGSIVRQAAPEIILTHGPYEYMEDHINTGRLAVSAAFCRGMTNFKVDPPRPAIETPVTIYHSVPHTQADQLRRRIVPGIFVDITQALPTKRKMLACHRSQKEWLDVSQGNNSYLNDMEEQCARFGALSKRFKYAEGWIRHANVGFCAPDADPLIKALGHDAMVNEEFEKLTRLEK